MARYDPIAYLERLAALMPEAAAEIAQERRILMATEHEEMASFRKDTTGIENTIFISPRAGAQHAALIKIAIDPPHTLNPRCQSASVAIADGEITEGDVPPPIRKQVQQFIDLNRDALVDYWEYRIDTGQLTRRLRAI
jgi:hypothetical protein